MRRSDQRREAVFALYQHEITGRPLEELLTGAPFTRELAQGPIKGERSSTTRSGATPKAELERIAPLERSIMRVALYEARPR